MTTSADAFGAHPVLRTHDLDEARAVLTATYVPISANYLGRPAPLDMRLNVVRLGAVVAGFVAFGQDLRFSTRETGDYHVNVPLSGQVESKCGGLEPVQGNAKMAAVFQPARIVEATWPGDCSQICMMFPPHTINLELERLLGRPVPKPVQFHTAMDLSTTAGRAWLDTLRLAEADSRREAGLLSHPLAAETFNYLLIDGLLLGQPNTYSAELAAPHLPAPTRSIARAIELLREQPEQPWTPSLLAVAVALSVRALHDGFKRGTGLSPMTYLREIRLAKVNTTLASGAPGTTVTATAASWGFVHLGRFAAAYRAKYGELPSETLRLSRGP